MNLYLITDPSYRFYDVYDHAVVCAETAKDAQTIHPNGKDEWESHNWASHPSRVKVQFIGEAAPHIARGVILASYKAA